MFKFDFLIKIEVGNAKVTVSTLVFKQVKLKQCDFVKVQRVVHLVAEAGEVYA